MGNYLFKAVIFDLDGVITKTAVIHAKAWKETFDEYLKLREQRDNEPFKEFTHENDYLSYVDGKPRYEGVKSFLESRGVNIDFGNSSDKSDKETVCGIGNRKNDIFRAVLDRDGAQMYPSTVDFIKELHKAGIKTGVASSSKNCQPILQSAGIEDLFETRVDGVVSAQMGLKGKPEGDIFVRAVRNLGFLPEEAIVVEDATSGVAAGRNGGFAFVLGIAREDNVNDLAKNGADIVVSDMSEISMTDILKWFQRQPVDLFDSWDNNDNNTQGVKEKRSGENICIVNPYYSKPSKDMFPKKKKYVFFLDYDGTLSPIVERPELAVISDEMKDTVERLSQKHLVAIISGRQREVVEDLAKIKDIFYAGSHGLDVKGPDISMINPQAQALIPVVDQITQKLKKEFALVEGILIEEKKFSVAIHYRLLKEESLMPKIEAFVNEIVQAHKGLRIMSGKKVFEIMPDLDWDKAKAIRFIMETLNITWEDYSVIYIGDDTTDEYAFRSFRTRGYGIVVSEKPKASAADYRVSTVDKVRELFERIIELS